MIESGLDNENGRLVSPRQNETLAFENSLRPKKFDEYIGQNLIKENLKVAILAAKNRSEQLDHILLHGGPGLGKTTLASLLASEFGVSLKITSGPALEKSGDLAAILSNLNAHDMLFIDEIHRLKPAIEEILYTAMEDFGIDLVVGKGPSARIMRLNLPRFTLLGATTKLSMLSSPLRDRFGSVFKFQFYSKEELVDVLKRSALILAVNLDMEAAAMLANASRFTPRIANRLLKRARDFASLRGLNLITKEVVAETLTALGIDSCGLDESDRKILRVMLENFEGRAVGLSTLSASIAEEPATIEEIYEPFLLQMGFLERSPRGRLPTAKARRYLEGGAEI